MSNHPDFEPVILGDVAELTMGEGSGYSEASGHQKVGGTLDQQPYAELPALPQV